MFYYVQKVYIFHFYFSKYKYPFQHLFQYKSQVKKPFLNLQLVSVQNKKYHLYKHDTLKISSIISTLNITFYTEIFKPKFEIKNFAWY